ncbi:MAG: HEAT repeat domain-containing protein [Nitrospirae bacterium]|nr:HEAT repeat domain-containing protein [Nitrospirota bacterium]
MQEIREVLNNLRADDWWVRKNTIENLLTYPEDSYLSIMEEWLRDDDPLLRNAAMETYRALGNKAVKSLISLLEDRNPDVRIFAANVFGDIKDGSAIAALIAALNDTDVNVRIASAESLGKLGETKAIDPLARGVNDVPWVAMACIEAIGEIGGDKAVSVLCKCLEKEEYRGITFTAIEKAGDNHVIKHLTPFIDKEDELRELSLKAVVNIADREGKKPMPSYFMRLIPLLIEMQGSPHPELRRAAFIALSWAEDIRGLQYLIDALNDDELQEYAIKGIISIGKKAVPGIIDALKKTVGRNRAILADILFMMGEYKALIQFADDNDPEVRVEAAIAMGHIPSARTLEMLSKMLTDPEDEVRLAAQKMLEDLNRVM